MVKEKLKNPGRRRFLRSVLDSTIKLAGGTVIGGVIARELALPALIKNAAEDLPLRSQDGLSILISKDMDDERRIKEYAKARLEMAFGCKANFYSYEATREDLRRSLYDHSIQNIVVFGHGSHLDWLATDGLVTFAQLLNLYNENPVNKSGLFVKHTCSDLESDRYGLPEFIPNSVEDIPKVISAIEELKKTLPLGVRDRYEFGEEGLSLYFTSRRSGLPVSVDELSPKARNYLEKLFDVANTAYENADGIMPLTLGSPFFKRDRIRYNRTWESQRNTVKNPLLEEDIGLDSILFYNTPITL